VVDGKKEQPESPVLELDAGWDDWGDEPAKGSEPVVNERPTLAPTFDLEAFAREKSSLGLPEKGAPPSGAPLPPPPPMTASPLRAPPLPTIPPTEPHSSHPFSRQPFSQRKTPPQGSATPGGFLAPRAAPVVQVEPAPVAGVPESHSRSERPTTVRIDQETLLALANKVAGAYAPLEEPSSPPAAQEPAPVAVASPQAPPRAPLPSPPHEEDPFAALAEEMRAEEAPAPPRPAQRPPTLRTPPPARPPTSPFARSRTPPPRALTPVPRTLTPAPRALTPFPRTLTPVPQTLTPVPGHTLTPRPPPPNLGQGGHPTPVGTAAAGLEPVRDDLQPEAPELAPEPPADDPFSEMRDRFALGDYSGALVMAESLLDENPSHPEALEYAESCRTMLTKMYTARIGPLDRVPLVEVKRDQLRWLSIDHRAGFVLSLVDGVSSLEMILDVSGMRELDALRILYELVQQRIISFQ